MALFMSSLQWGPKVWEGYLYTRVLTDVSEITIVIKPKNIYKLQRSPDIPKGRPINEPVPWFLQFQNDTLTHKIKHILLDSYNLPISQYY